MVTVSGCQNITAWLEKSQVISDAALWQAVALAIHSHHPVITVIADKIINQTSIVLGCLSYTHARVHKNTHGYMHTSPIQDPCKHTHTHLQKHRKKTVSDLQVLSLLGDKSLLSWVRKSDPTDFIHLKSSYAITQHLLFGSTAMLPETKVALSPFSAPLRYKV